MPGTHAILSPSSSERWINCPPSAKENAGGDTGSTYAQQGTDAHVNRVLFWLSSKRDDYVRESFKGGILYDLLNIRCNDEELTSWEQTIKEKFNNEFSGELELVYLKLTSNPKQKKIIINMIVRDKLENKTFPISTEAKA